jgi:hypothetical protein
MPMGWLMRLPSDLLVVDQPDTPTAKQGAQGSTALGADRIHDYSNVRNNLL